MNNSLEHISACQRRQLELITRMIVSAVRPEKIILFGVHGVSVKPGRRTAGEFAVVEGYDILVVTRKGERRYDHELQDIMENKCRSTASVNVLVHDIDHVNARLTEGHYFFSLMARDATLLYDAGIVPLVAARAPDLARIRMLAKEDFDKWARRARGFFNSALFNMREKEYRLAVFLLHQAAEQIYQAILLVFMGYKPCTHNLDKLRRYTNRFSIELALLFPRNSTEEEHLFKLLMNAYVDARYKDEYAITERESDLLAERVTKLLSIAERVSRNRFTSLEKMASGC